MIIIMIITIIIVIIIIVIINIFGSDIGIESGTKKSGILALKRGKVARCEGIQLINSEVIKEAKKEG